jgi:hypothetical protein
MVIRGFQDNGITTIDDLKLAIELILMDAFHGIGARVLECHGVDTIRVTISRCCEEGDLNAVITVREEIEEEDDEEEEEGRDD